MPEPTKLNVEQAQEMISAEDTVLLSANGQIAAAAFSLTEMAIFPEPIKAEELVGTIVAERYLVESYVGGGGMSHVYKARHLHLKHKVVALKLLQPKVIVDPQHVLRLEHEANAVGSLSHPNIIAIQDFGLSGPTQPYLVMEFFEGRSLEQLISDEGPLDIERLLGILGQICSALSHAHEMGVVHRDIKPSNIMVAQDSQGKDVVKVVDFGIAKRSVNEEAVSKLTHTGDILGSPLYMSPEQCRGQSVDGRSDIYSLGCVIYESITGVSPFGGDTVFETIYRHLNEAPKPFAASALRDARIRGLETIVFRMLAKRPSERYHFMVEVASDLKQLEYTVLSATGQLRLMLGLWKARRAARARKSVVLDSGLAMLSIAAVILTVFLFVLPGQVRQTAAEEARNSMIVNEMRSGLNILKGDNSLLENIFSREELSPTGSPVRARLYQSFQVLTFLCKQNPSQQLALNAVEDSVDEASSATALFKASLAPRISRAIFGGLKNPKEDKKFGALMSAWSNTVVRCNELAGPAYVMSLESGRQRVFYESAFALCKWLGVIVLFVLPYLLCLRWLNRKKSQ